MLQWPPSAKDVRGGWLQRFACDMTPIAALALGVMGAVILQLDAHPLLGRGCVAQKFAYNSETDQ